MLRFSFWRHSLSLLTSVSTQQRRLVLINGKTIGAILGNYDVALLAGQNVMHDSDSLKGDNVLNRIPKSFKTVILIFCVS